jgi:hypothetical protein
MTLLEKRTILRRKAESVAFSYYIRRGYVPALLTKIIAAAYSDEACLKFNPNHDELGRFTFGSSGSDDNIDDPPIEPVYPIETLLLTFLPGGRLLAAWRALAENAGTTIDAEWTLGSFKSPETWANQIADRNWTPEDITNILSDGGQFPAPNKVNPENTATRYQDPTTGRYVVRDDVTKEILQVSAPGFIPNE